MRPRVFRTGARHGSTTERERLGRRLRATAALRFVGGRADHGRRAALGRHGRCDHPGRAAAGRRPSRGSASSRRWWLPRSPTPRRGGGGAARGGAGRATASRDARRGGVPPGELFAAVTEEVGKLLCGDSPRMIRYKADGTVSPVAVWGAVGEHPSLPRTRPAEEGDLATMVAEAGGPVRVDDWEGVPGRHDGLVPRAWDPSSVASPIWVDGRLWGALAIHSQGDKALPGGTESRLVSFTELVATAMANAEARREVERLAEEQAALRRVATLVAEGAKPAAVFDAVAGGDGGAAGRRPGRPEPLRTGRRDPGARSPRP